MGRYNRKSLLFDGCYAHVFSRAIEKRYIFQSSEDFQRFKELLLISKQRYAYRIHHYCLMNTHFHLVVSLDHVKEFSEGLKWLKWQYARYYNVKRKRFGPLWRDRFKSRLIEDEEYMKVCGNYVEGNPVEAGMVKKSEDWPHSSSRYYVMGQEDYLVDAYCSEGKMAVSEELKRDCQKASVIGTELFKIHVEEGMFNDLCVTH